MQHTEHATHPFPPMWAYGIALLLITVLAITASQLTSV
jgi:hypothetical protein